MTPEGFRAFRYRHSLPQAELAQALGVARSKIVDLEHGRAQPSRLLLLALAAYADGLEPYESDPADLRAFAAKRPNRINRALPAPALRLVMSR